MEKQATVLIVDDEMRMRRVIADYLHIKHYRTIEAADGVEALERFRAEQPDLVLLDVMMPRMNGWEVCRTIRQTHRTPIIMLTARSEEDDELQGFELGADEYIAKPFSLKILLARIEAVLRRHDDPAAAPAAELLHVDRLSREVTVDGVAVQLTYTEFELLEYLITNKGLALSRDKILDNVWKYDYDGDARTVDTHIKKLRSKLGEAGEMIKTIRGIGYKFEG
ncbi:MAG: response regulator transcription factor [Clostridia bacterium]|nr:response regulator transcription factor [Clostridia bacterium]